MDLALTLVGYSDEVSNAMAYVFGDTLVCADAAAAKAVTFNKSVGVKCVTLEGDVYDPSGTLTGGSAIASAGILVRAQELNRAESELRAAVAVLNELERSEKDGKQARESWKKLSRELEIKEHELHLLEEQVGGSNAARVSPGF